MGSLVLPKPRAPRPALQSWASTDWLRSHCMANWLSALAWGRSAGTWSVVASSLETAWYEWLPMDAACCLGCIAASRGS